MKKDKRELVFYFDYLSPYSFLAWKKVGRLWEKYDLVLRAEPVVLGALLSRFETKGPAEVPEKRQYVYKDILRSAGREQVNIQFPPAHPFNPLLALRATCLMEDHREYNRFITHLFTLCWQEGADLTNPDLINKVLKIYGVENGVEKCSEEAIKQKLREKTDKAIEQGIFGVPMMVIDSEMFWGNDRVDFLEEYITGNENVDPDMLRKLADIPIGVERKKKD